MGLKPRTSAEPT